MSKQETILRVPQARVLKALLPKEGSDNKPSLTRNRLAVKAGFSEISGSINRALLGIRKGSSSGDPHKGLLQLEYVKIVELDKDGIKETTYQITAAGVKAYNRFMEEKGKMPKAREAEACVNHRYQ